MTRIIKLGVEEHEIDRIKKIEYEIITDFLEDTGKEVIMKIFLEPENLIKISVNMESPSKFTDEVSKQLCNKELKIVDIYKIIEECDGV